MASQPLRKELREGQPAAIKIGCIGPPGLGHAHTKRRQEQRAARLRAVLKELEKLRQPTKAAAAQDNSDRYEHNAVASERERPPPTIDG